MLKILFIFFFIFSVSGCHSSKKSQQTSKEEKSIVIPDDMVISPEVSPTVRDAQIEWFEKGKTLYKLHCGDCHGIFTQGKDGVPNFTKTQIDNYLAIVLANPQNHQVIKKLSMEQFNYIITFLRLRKIDK